jgi:phosphatidylserine decarboxylase
MLAIPLIERFETFHAVLEIQIKSGHNFPRMDLNGEADPFVDIHIGDKKVGTTKIIYKTRNPTWNQTFRILLPEQEKHYLLTFNVWDWDKASSNDFIGVATLKLADVLESKSFDGSLPVLLHKKKKKKDKSRGEIKIAYRVYFADEVMRIFWKDVFDFFDSSENGMSALEFAGLLEAIGAPVSNDQLSELFATIDENKDGEISFEELFSVVSGPRLDQLDEKTKELVMKIIPSDPNLPWTTFALGTSEQHGTGGALVSNWHTHIPAPLGESDKHKPTEIIVHNRETGNLETEKIPNFIKVAMRLMYSHGAKFAVDTNRVKKILHSMSVKQGKKYSNPASVKDIDHFIEFHNLNREEMLDPAESFANFNEFFYRKLKPSARPIASPDDPKIAVSPADSRLNVFVTIEEAQKVWIKGQHFNLASLLQDVDLAKHYEGGSLVIARLAPQDYHRFHSPVNGTIRSFTPIDGTYFTVNPVAVKTSMDVYTENKRVVCPIETDEFGLVTFVAIGATMVGTITFTTKVGDKVKKGDEHGFFAFGGSTVLLLFPPNSIEFDKDLVVNSANALETLVKVGTSIGRATK